MRRVIRLMMWVLPFVICMSFASARQTGSAQNSAAGIGGAVVNATSGKPEPGVWVIAETKLQTGFRKIVVTDDQGRFFVPDLPAASYELWVRGYGLKDSAKTKVERGAQVRLQATAAATPGEAATIYPSAHWVSLIQPPATATLPAAYKTPGTLARRIAPVQPVSSARYADDHASHPARAVGCRPATQQRDELRGRRARPRAAHRRRLADWTTRIVRGRCRRHRRGPSASNGISW